jgi:2-polyprenyl-3-methyl-5-hydroxy-6-metoxy-1,4-benzoquinol methylase
MQITPDQLDEFVRTSDGLGGPGSPECDKYWAEFSYAPNCQVNQEFDPLGEAYVSEQVRLHREISGHSYDVQQHEQTSFDIKRHIAAVNPYDHPDPKGLAVHVQRLARALRYANPKRDEVLLDMGCGWGLSSEVAAYLGLTVIGVDVNPTFVTLVNERAKRFGHAITAVTSTFEDFAPLQSFDIAFFYECLHHSIRPWIVVDRLAKELNVGGRLVLAGEPINSLWWKFWGLRLDALSVYCIRKFGWFESGWSLAFIEEVLRRAGLVVSTYFDKDPEIGYALVAEKKQASGQNVASFDIAGNLVADRYKTSGCTPDGKWLILSGTGEMTLEFPSNAKRAVLNVSNFRGRPLRVLITSSGDSIFEGSLRSGTARIGIPRLGSIAALHFEVEQWVPDDELHNGDKRSIGLHLEGITFVCD